MNPTTEPPIESIDTIHAVLCKYLSPEASVEAALGIFVALRNAGYLKEARDDSAHQQELENRV